MRRAVLLLTVIGITLLLASGAALAAVITCRSDAIPCYGTNGDDVIRGTEDDDRIIAGSRRNFGSDDRGDDVVYGRGGFDEIYGIGGGDTLYGGEDGDQLYGHNGKDVLYGGPGHDVSPFGLGGIEGGYGSDTLYGGDGNDFMQGEYVPISTMPEQKSRLPVLDTYGDVIYADSGDDYMNGDFGSDVLHGGEGDDFVTDWTEPRSSATNVLYGGDGNDELDADSRGKDRLYCGSGRDLAIAGENDVVARDCERVRRTN